MCLNTHLREVINSGFLPGTHKIGTKKVEMECKDDEKFNLPINNR